MQQKQLKDVPLDPQLQYGDFSLFGFHSLSDWFGSDFIDLSAQFILNGASFAEQKGYKVSLDEAKTDLTLIYDASIQKMEEQGVKELPSLNEHLRGLGFNLKSASEVWRKVLLFRRYFQGVSSATFIDRLPFTDFARYAKEAALLDMYEWPSSLRLRSLNDLIEFQGYLSMVAPSLKNPLALPASFFPMETVAAKCPELVPEQYKIRFKEISLQEVGLKASFAEVLDWELDEKNWALLKKEFSFLLQLPQPTKTERFQILETLEAQNRAEIDRFARLSLARKHPEWIFEALASLAGQEKKIFVAEGIYPLAHIRNTAQFAALLKASSQGDSEAKQALSSYCDNEKNAYAVEILEVFPHSVLTFAEAKEVKILTKVSDRMLEDRYLQIGAADPTAFRNQKGDWLPLSQVRETVAKDFFAPLFKAIASLEKKEWTDANSPMYRLLFATQSALEDIKKNGESSSWLAKEETSLANQFKMEKKESKIERTMKEGSIDSLAFNMEEQSWSPVQVCPNGEIKFFYLSEKKAQEDPILEQISFGKAALGADAQRYLCEKFLKLIKSKQSIVIPLQGEQK